MSQFTVTTEADLNHLVETHQSYLSNDVIVDIVGAIPMKFQEDYRTWLLESIVFYHLQHKKPADEREWETAYAMFANLIDMDGEPLFEFYVQNYAFLAGRNAEMNAAILHLHFNTAKEAAEEVAGEVRHQLMGFLIYNWSRYLLKNGQQSNALQFWQEAAAARTRWYVHVRDNGEQAATVRAAKTQVWKMREDFPSFFPGMPIEQCGVSAELFAEVALDAHTAFSAKPA